MKTCSPLVLALLCVAPLFGQKADFQCAEPAFRLSDALRKDLYGQKQAEIDLALASFTAKNPDAVYTLPVVVHLIHDGGPENISDAQVQQAIQHLNDAFSHSGFYATAGPGTDTGVRFCLARRQPDGSPTTGIVRVPSVLTEMNLNLDDLDLKNLSRWDPTRYINIWVVRSIESNSLGSGVAGYAFLAAAHGEDYDGLVIEADFFGASASLDAVAVHEMGHYLNLYHTFEGACENDNCLTQGDRVCDTPPDQVKHSVCPFNSCDTDADAPPPNPFSSDVADMTENYLDYSPFACYHRFSPGQAERMQATVATVRYSLLQSQACQEPCYSPIDVAFTADATTVPAGTAVQFTNLSNGATFFDWRLDGTSFSGSPNLQYPFTQAGVFTVQLNGYNADPNCVDSAFLQVIVTCPVIAAFDAPLEISVGETVNFTNNSVGATSYEWWVNGLLLSTDPNFSQNFTAPGVYTIVLRAAGVCESSVTRLLHVRPLCGPGTGQMQFDLTPFQRAYYFDAVTSPTGDLYLSGLINNQTVITKMSAGGTVLWTRQDGYGEYYQISRMFATDDGGVLYLRLKTSDTDQGTLIKRNADGSEAWSRAISSAPLTAGWVNRFFTLHPDGSISFISTIQGGDQIHHLASDGSLLWTKRLTYPGLQDVHDLVAATNGGLWVSVSAFVNGPERGVVLRLDANGNFLWAKAYYTANAATMPSSGQFKLHREPDNGFSLQYSTQILAGSMTARSILIRCDAAGNVLWSKQYSTTVDANLQAVGHVVPMPDGQYLHWNRTSQFNAANQLINVYYLSRISSQGDVVWTRAFDLIPAGLDQATAFCLAGGRLFFSGWYHLNNANKATYWFNVDWNDPEIEQCYLTPAQLTASALPITVVTAPQASVASHQNPPLATVAGTQALNVQTLAACPETTTSSCPEICDNEYDDDGDGHVDCYDTECFCFDGADCSLSATQQPLSVQLAWQTPTDLTYTSRPLLVADLNPPPLGDGIPEIISLSAAFSTDVPGSTEPFSITAKIQFLRGDGGNAASPREYAPLPPGNPNNLSTIMPVVADIDRNGVPELIYIGASDQRIRVLTDYREDALPPENAMRLWFISSDQADPNTLYPFLADFDADGKPEVYAGNDIFQFDFSDPAHPDLRKKLDGNGPAGRTNQFSSQNLATACHPMAADLLGPADCGGDPDCEGLELAAGYAIYSIDLDPTDGDGFEIKVKRDLHQFTSGITWRDGYTSVADLNLDGIPELLTSGERNSTAGVYVWNKNGLLAFFSTDAATQFLDATSIAVVENVYNDLGAGFAKDFPEVLVASESRLYVFNLNRYNTNVNQPQWWSLPMNDETEFAAPTVFDLNGDGHKEILYRDQSYLRVLYGGPAPFPAGVDPVTREWARIDCGSTTADEYPVVADVDADGQSEFVVTGNIVPYSDTVGPRGRVRVFESGGTPWQPSRRLWHAFNYQYTQINDDLSVPVVPQRHWLEFPGPGGGKYPFNQANCQIPVLNASFDPYFPVADLLAAPDSAFCANGFFQVELTVCNTGSVDLPGGTPVAFYSGDPTQTAAALLGVPTFLAESLPRDSCRTLTFKLPPVDGPVFCVVNDDGSLPRPFSLASDFPAGERPECDYTNNLCAFPAPPGPTDFSLGPDREVCAGSVEVLQAGPGFVQYRWQDGFTDSLYTAYGPGTYWVEARDACGRTFSDTLQITLSPTALLDLGPDRDICFGDSVQLAATGFEAYSWTPAAALDCPDCASVWVKPAATLTVGLTARSGSCFVTDSVRIEVRPVPHVDWEILGEACADMPFGLEVHLTTGAPPFTYLWSTGDTTAVADSLSSGFHTLTVTDAYGCFQVDTFFLNTGNGVQISVSTVQPLCFGQNGLVETSVENGTPPFIYEWSNGADSSVLHATAGQYTLIVSDALGCSDTLNVELTEPPLLTAATLDKYPATCPGDSDGGLTVAANGGTPPYHFDWSNGATTPVQTLLSAGVYSLTLTDAHQCTAFLTDSIGYAASLPALSVMADTITCGHPTATLTALSDPDATLSWQTPDGSTLAGPLQTVSQPGLYSVQAVNGSGCSSAATVSVENRMADLTAGLLVEPASCFGQADGLIRVESVAGGTMPYIYSFDAQPFGPAPEATGLPAGSYEVSIRDAEGCVWDSSGVVIGQQDSFAVRIDTVRTTGMAGEDVLQISAQFDPADRVLSQIQWEPAVLFAPANQLQYHLPLPLTATLVVLLTDEQGCMATDSLAIRIDETVAEDFLYFPTVIRPGAGDNGYFTVFGSTQITRIESLQIYNRWGGLIFETRAISPGNLSGGWPGTLADGSPAAPGVYVFAVTVKHADGRSTIHRGTLTVLD